MVVASLAHQSVLVSTAKCPVIEIKHDFSGCSALYLGAFPVVLEWGAVEGSQGSISGPPTWKHLPGLAVPRYACVGFW